ncbi:hypothetical protein AWH56_008685 [Anaerobacillus isosaccharinicus]|uniref:Uncharacterized protein n=1 Tax=Anaerobacillus isosaccharinicus TaxID=1532552 RepID=A0A1S2L102_9BACI|nr:hypothetical protein [Anaerobacillus isosaccharinicus]MBA5588951.1 hypothetical protein [Anaerobacillus isosaccharinicus]QOY37640.1 hypothetical protein AWH56_008685 [Anaerobacillus isosaccharinicus]
MSQNEKYWEYRNRYNEIEKEISELYAEQRKMRDLMEHNCNHSNLELVNYSPIEVEMGIVDEDEVQYKCQDCWCYFNLKEAKEMNLI